jgi:hypothetical protein
MRMTQIGRQHRQAPFEVFARPIPLNEGIQGETVSKIVKARSGVVVRAAQANLAGQLVEGSAHGGGIESTAMIVEQKAG